MRPWLLASSACWRVGACRWSRPGLAGGRSVAKGVERDRGVRVRAAGAHLGGDPDRFHDLLVARTLAPCEPGVPADAVRALRGVRERDRDQLLGHLWQRAFGKDAVAERSERI